MLLIEVKPTWPDVFIGFIPSAELFDTRVDVLYTGNACYSVLQRAFLTKPLVAVGILGATVMPHALFLGSFLATRDRVGTMTPELPFPTQSSENSIYASPRARLRAWLKSLFTVSRAERIAASRDYRNKYGRENNGLAFVRAHLTYGIVDIVGSLLGLAVPINSASVDSACCLQPSHSHAKT